MSTKLHSGLKRTLAWLLTAAMLAQGCFVVSADDFSSEPAAAQETQADTQSDAEAVDFDTDAVETTESSDDVTSGEEEIAAPDVEQDADVEDISQEADSEELTAPETTDDNAAAEQNAFDDGSAVAAFSDGTDAQDVSDLKRDTGEIAITKNENYSYTRLYDEKGYIKLAVGTYPANNSTVTVKVGDKKGLQYRTLYTTSTQTDYKKASWSNCTSQNMGQYQYGVEWKSSNENVAKVVSNSQYGPYTTGVWVQGISEGTTTITSTWKPGSKFKDSDGNYTLGTVTNSFTVKVEKAADPVEVGTSFTLNGSPSSPFQVAREGSSAAKLYWGRTSSVNYSIPESTESFDNSGMTTCNASWGAWSDTGEITHAFCINYAEMIGGVLDSKKGAYDNSTYRESVSSYSPGGTTDVFLRPCKMPADGIYVTGTGGDRGSFVNNNVVFDRVSSNSYVYVYAYCIKNQQKVDSATFYSNIKWSSSDESVMKVARQDKYSVQLASYKAGIATLHGSYQPVDSEGNPDGEPLTIDVKVIVCGFYIDEKAEDGTNTIEMSLDDESITRKIQYKVIDSTGEAEPTDIISWSCDKPAIASVDSDGVVKAKAAGEATVTAQYGDSSTNKDTVKIIVKGAGSLGFDKAESKVKKGGTDTIKATATYNGSTVRNADIKWESENPAIATVDNGKITGISEGTTTVKASWTAENGKTYTNNATVKVVYDGLYLSDAQNEVTLAQKSTQEIVWQLLDMGEYSSGSTGEGYNTSSDVTWTSANEDLITVDSVGVITAKELPEGEEKAETTVSVSYKGNKVKDIKVTVVKNQAITTGTTTDVAGTKGETKTDKDGADKSNTWKTGAYKAGHGSLGSEFNSSANYLEIADGTGSTASVKGKSPSQGYAYLSHKYYIPLTTGQLCGVWQGIAVKVTGAAGLYLNKSSVSMKMGENNTATIQGTYITESGEEWGHWANEKHPDYSTIHMIDGDTNVVTAAPDPKNGSVLKLTAVAPGKTTITVQFDTSTLTATCDVEVTSDARLVLTPADKLRVVQGDTQTIEAKAWDGSAYVENPEITWQSYNTKIATVDDKGGVTGVKKGSVGVAATWNGITSDPVQVTVVPSRTLNVTTTWDDDNNRDGKRPEKTTLQLTTTDGENVGDPVELNADNEWKYTWKNLASEDEDGQHISYLVTAVEDDTLTANNYTAEVTRSSSDDEFVVTYKHEIEKTGITANVTWDDADNQDGIRPKEVTLQLKADGEAVGDAITVKADSNGNWTKTWSNLPVNKEGAVGQAIVYTVEESGLPDGYAPAVAIDEETGAITVKNSHTPAVKDLTVSAKWDDADNQDGVRPASVDAVLYAGDTATDKTVTLTAEENWTATIKDMPVYAAGKVGEAVNYSLKAAKEVEDYTSATDGLTLTFTHKAAVTAVTATITWDDAENQDGIRPDSVTLQLKADGESVGSRITVDGTNDKWTKTWDNLPVNKAGKKVTYTVEQTGLRSEYTQATAGDAATGFTITNSYTPKGVDIAVSANWDDQDNQDGIRPEAVEAELYADNVSTNKKVRLTADTDWKATFEKLAVNKNGKPINYTLQATKVEGYDLTTEGSGADGLVLKYTHKVKAVDVTATVKWADGENQDGIRPNTVNLQLKADGENVGDAIVVNANSNWTKTWSGLAEYKAGKKVTYTVEATGIRSEYKVEITGDAATGFTVTATHVPAKAEVKASVVWDDADNQDGIRPEAVEAEIYAGDVSNSKKVRLTAENNWTASFGEMELKKDGQEIKYTLVGTKADGYTYTCTGSGAAGLVLTYTHKPEVVSVSVNTTWNDKNNQDGIRPATISVQLMKDDKEEGDNINLKIASSKTWSNLPKYANGKEIKYAVAISDVSGYTKKVTGSVADGYVAAFTHSVYKTSVVVQNTWSDLDNALLTRPSSLTVQIYANGKATSKKVVLNSANKWKATVSGLNKNSAGKKIAYSAKLVKTPTGYKVTIGSISSKGTIAIKNTYTKFTKKLTVKISPTKVTYNGKTRKPAVKSVYYGKTKLSSSYYTVSFKNNKNPGIGSVIVKGKGKYAKYAGSATFSILPKAPTGLTAKSTAKKQATVTWKGSTGATGYQIMISQKSDFRKGTTRTFTIRDSKRRSGVPKPMTSGRTYYIRIRSYKTTSNGKTVYSAWSKSTKTKIK